MPRIRRLLESAVNKLDEIGEKSHAADVAKLSPAERERYEAWEAQSAAARAGVPLSDLPDPRLVGRVLQGPAGEAAVGIRKAPRVDEPIEDASAWEQQMLRERAVRDAARAPYLAPGRHPVRITRVAARGKSQLQEVAEHLATTGLAARPDLVYGAYRVPDLISPGRFGGEKGAVVEWDVVHGATDALPPCAPPAAFTLDAGKVWVARSPGEPSPLDEDLALDVLVRADIGPLGTLAIARDVVIRKEGGGEDSSSSILAGVRGVHVLVRAEAGPAVKAALDTPGPWALREGPPEGVVVDVLQWDAIARAVHPVRQHRAPMPSPYPYLPVTPQELLRSYLDIVGVDPADCLSAQVTYDRPMNLMGRTSTGRWITVQRTGGGPDLPCADGRARKRMAGGHHVVVAYRDRPQYAEGRRRFGDYAEAELHAYLQHGLGLREPVPKPPSRLEKTLNRAGEVYEFFALEPGYEGNEFRPRYCWPPVGR